MSVLTLYSENACVSEGFSKADVLAVARVQCEQQKSAQRRLPALLLAPHLVPD